MHARQPFGDACAYSYDLDGLAEYFSDYRRVMRNGTTSCPGGPRRTYADLVPNPSDLAQGIRILRAWKPGCMDLARNTAQSLDHERYAGAPGSASNHSNQWRHFVTRLEPLQHALNDIRDAQRVRCGCAAVAFDQATYCLRLSELSAPESCPGRSRISWLVPGGITRSLWPENQRSSSKSAAAGSGTTAGCGACRESNETGPGPYP